MVRSIEDLPAVSIAQALAARPGTVDLWCFFYDELWEQAGEGTGAGAGAETAEPELAASYFSLMTPEERARHDRFYFARDRRLFLATRALVRTVLSSYAPVAPAQWRFADGERGKPYVVSPPDAAAIHFNLSNTPGLVVCAVSLAHAALGVDAEFVHRIGETLSIADHYFSPTEVRALRALPPSRQRERFFSYWTLKESYIKARGLGLAIPLEQFSFLLPEAEAARGPEAGSGIGVVFDPRLGDDERRWRFALLRGGPDHLIAVGVDTGGAPLSLRAARCIPLRGVVDWDSSGSRPGPQLADQGKGQGKNQP